jgi:hypothetical protein
MDEKEQNIKQFQKKVYTRLSKSDLASLNPKESINQLTDSLSQKKIIATTIGNNIREEFKKNFVPLLIEVFELRQSINNYKNQQDHPFSLNQTPNSLKEITNRLEILQKEIEETKRWCESVSLQIAKGLQEATNSENQSYISEKKDSFTNLKSKFFLKKLLRLFDKKNRDL